MKPGANLDLIAKRFAALEHAWKAQSGTKQLNAGFDSVRAAIDVALRERAAWLQGPFRPVPRNAAQVAAAYLAPELRGEVVAPAVDLDHDPTKCPRCLGPADRADVERTGVCYDCGNAGFATKLSPAAIDEAREQPSLSASPPALGGQQPVAESIAVGAVVPTNGAG